MKKFTEYTPAEAAAVLERGDAVLQKIEQAAVSGIDVKKFRTGQKSFKAYQTAARFKLHYIEYAVVAVGALWGAWMVSVGAYEGVVPTGVMVVAGLLFVVRLTNGDRFTRYYFETLDAHGG